MFSSALIVSVFLFTCFLTSVDSADSTEKTVKPGEDVLLHCQGPRNATIRLLKWTGPYPESEGYVFYFRDNQLHDDRQHPSFHGRVKLRDPEMKNGNFSVTLKNVTMNDTGRYECYTGDGGNVPQLISNIRLKVESGNTGGHREEGGDKEGDSRGHVGLIVGLSVCALIVGFAVGAGVMIYRRRRGCTKQNSDPPPLNEAAVPLQSL